MAVLATVIFHIVPALLHDKMNGQSLPLQVCADLIGVSLLNALIKDQTRRVQKDPQKLQH